MSHKSLPTRNMTIIIPNPCPVWNNQLVFPVAKLGGNTPICPRLFCPQTGKLLFTSRMLKGVLHQYSSDLAGCSLKQLNSPVPLNRVGSTKPVRSHVYCKKEWKRLMSFVIRTLIFVKSWGWEQSENVTSTSPATQITDQISVKLYSDISVRFVLYTVNILVLRKDFIEDCSHLAKAKHMFVSHNHLKPTTTSTAIFFSPQTPNRPQNHSLTKEVPV